MPESSARKFSFFPSSTKLFFPSHDVFSLVSRWCLMCIHKYPSVFEGCERKKKSYRLTLAHHSTISHHFVSPFKRFSVEFMKLWNWCKLDTLSSYSILCCVGVKNSIKRVWEREKECCGRWCNTWCICVPILVINKLDRNRVHFLLTCCVRECVRQPARRGRKMSENYWTFGEKFFVHEYLSRWIF